MITSIINRYDGDVRAVLFQIKHITVGFGIYRWPWILRDPSYKKLAAQILDNPGVFKWLFFARKWEETGHTLYHLRALCVSVGLRIEP